MLNENWITDRKPEKAGCYVVTLEYEDGDYDNKTGIFTPNGKMFRELDVRYFAEPGELGSWAMKGEDPDDYHWTEQTGSSLGEHVVAWMPHEQVGIYKGGLRPGAEYTFEGEEND